MSLLSGDWAQAARDQDALSASVGKIHLQSTTSSSAVVGKTTASGPPSVSPASAAADPVGSGDDDEQPSVAETALLQKIVRSGLVDNHNTIEVQRSDPSSPLYSVKSFEALALRPDLLRGVYGLGFNAPSKIQELALPIMLADPPQNLIAQSQSGTGKTAAFVLAMISRVDAQKQYPQALCLSPTYELALQTGSVVERMAEHMPSLRVKYAVRGQNLARHEKLTEQIIIGTPGKTLDWAQKYRFFDITKISVFVLDEADVMIAMQGHQDQSIRIHKMVPSTCQMLFFSATYSHEVMQFAEAIVTKPVVMRLKREEESVDNIRQYYVQCANDEAKYAAIANIYGVVTIGQAVIFCHTKRNAGWLSRRMCADGHSVALLSGELTVEQRISVLDRFRDAKEKVLIATNVMCRGIDIEQVTIVVNFDLPIDTSGQADCETYLHRIGRTGRFGKSGIAISLVNGVRDEAILQQIQTHFGRKIHRLDAEDVDEVEKLNSVQ